MRHKPLTKKERTAFLRVLRFPGNLPSIDRQELADMIGRYEATVAAFEKLNPA